MIFGNLCAWYFSPNRFPKPVCMCFLPWIFAKLIPGMNLSTCKYLTVDCMQAGWLSSSFFWFGADSNLEEMTLPTVYAKAYHKVLPVFAVVKGNGRIPESVLQREELTWRSSRCGEHCEKQESCCDMQRRFTLPLVLLCSCSWGGFSQETSILGLSSVPDSLVELRLDFVQYSLCSWEQAFPLIILKMFQSCVPNKHVLFGAGTVYG